MLRHPRVCYCLYTGGALNGTYIVFPGEGITQAKNKRLGLWIHPHYQYTDVKSRVLK